jgi:phosphohistidine phosphatase
MSTTTLYLIRHGIAAERGTYADDRDRPLTAKGRDRTERVAQRLSQLGIGFDLLLSSPLVRAYETAEILVYQGLAPYFTRHDALAPGGDLADWLTWLGDWQVNQPESTVAIVGHEPDLSAWAQQLVIGSTSGNWRLKKAGIIGLTLPAADQALGSSELFWFTPPRLLLD